MDDQPMLNLRKAATRWIVMTSEGDYPAVKRLVEIELETVHGKVPHAVAVALRKVSQSHDTQEIDGLLFALAEGGKEGQDTATLAESKLSVPWDLPEEDAPWRHL